MPITIECQGALVLLDLLEHAAQGRPVSVATVRDCLLRNSYFVDFYCQWDGVTTDALCRALSCIASAPERHPVVSRLQAGFLQASACPNELRRRIAALQGVDFRAMEGRLKQYLPHGTPIDCTIHLTIDEFNGAFQYQDGIGLSLTRPFSDPEQFSDLVCHELHHLGFRYWATRDTLRQALLSEQTARAVVVEHVENLIREGMAVFFFTPAQFSGTTWALVPQEYRATYGAKVESFRRNEKTLFRQAEDVLREAFRPGADLGKCQRTAREVAVDLDGVQPPGHYLGWRMIQTIAARNTVEQVLVNIKDISGFLEQYNEAARGTEAHVFSPEVVHGYSQMWSELRGAAG